MATQKQVQYLIQTALRCKELWKISWETMAASTALPALFEALKPFEKKDRRAR